MISVHFLENSLALGCLLQVVMLNITNGEADFTKLQYLTLNKNSSLNYSLPPQLSSGWYIISAYDIEESGTIQDGIAYPAFTKTCFEMQGL